MSDERHSTALPASVHAAELRTIKARRAAAGLDAAPDLDAPLTSGEGPGTHPGDPAEERRPSTRRGLIGLAISGGGIRSSTFSLGVLQSLAYRGIFRWFDYLSTVSGGGYTGSMLSSILNEPRDPADPFPLDKPAGTGESPALRHLRNGSNYLSPGGLLNTLRLPAVVVRGLLLNALLLLPWLMFSVFFTEWLHERQFVDRTLAASDGWLVSIPLVSVGIFIIGYFLLSRADHGSLTQRNRRELGLAVVLLVVGVVLLAVPFVHLVELAIETPYSRLEALLQEYLRWKVWVIAAGVFVGAYTLVKASEQLQATRKLHALVSKALLYGAAVLGPGLLLGCYLLLLVAQVDSPFITLPGGTLPDVSNVTESGVYTLELSEQLREELEDRGVVYPSATVPVRYCPQYAAWQAPLPGPAGGVTTPPAEHCTWPNSMVEIRSEEAAAGDPQAVRSFRLTATPWSRKYDYEMWGARLHLGGAGGEHSLMDDSHFFLIALAILLGNTVLLNVNLSSLHRFYRDRLSQLYLFRVADDQGTVPNDDQTLSDLNRSGSPAPYHIVNTTLNLQGDRVESTRGRSSDFFMFSKHFCGSPHTGYCPTKELEKVDPRANLGTAMAISAAAAAPNMGSATNRSLVFIMTLLNFRLNYWLPNPRWVNEVASGTRRKVPFWTFRPGVMRLANEALGRLTATGSMVNLSDGGHLENLATYELLRRRCRLIVLIDGEADPDLTFHGLVTLIRLAHIDLGVSIYMDPNSLERIQWRPETRNTESHFAFGEIDYGGGERGVLVYVKSSVTGDENPYIKRYRADNPAFPHETTADQFFDETQFEAYRSLGHHVGSGVADTLSPELMEFIEAKIADYAGG